MFGNWRSLSSIYSQAKTGSWALNDSPETVDKNLWGLLLSCWTESHWNYFLWGKLSCEQDTLLLFILLQPGPSVPCWWKPGDYFLVICVYFEDSCIWVKTGAVELHFIFFPLPSIATFFKLSALPGSGEIENSRTENGHTVEVI